MIIPSDPDYQRAKAIKKGQSAVKSPFREIAQWVAEKYDVKVVSAEYERVIPDNRPRLSIILDTSEETQKFQDGPLSNFNRVEQKSVAEKFESIVQEMGFNEICCGSLFVIFSSFEKVAVIDAHDRIPEKKVKALEKKLEGKQVWKVFQMFGSVTFFFHTEEQLNNSKLNGLRSEFRKLFYDLVKSFDEFEYITLDNLIVEFDSKENFNKNYGSSWFAYTR